MFITLLQMETKIQHEGFSRTMYAYSNSIFYGAMVYFSPKPNPTVIEDEREGHWRIVFEDNNGGVDGTKALLHANKWNVYNLDKEALVKDEYLVEVDDKEGKTLIWEVVNDNVVDEGF